ncbi:unnamed protein product, partial [Bubo scandiacus]
MEHIILLLLVSLFFLCQAHGALECREQAVSASETLRLLPEKPPQRWVKVDWRVTLDSGHNFRILTAEKNQADQFPKSPFSGRAGFQRNNLSLWISAVGTADSGVYRAEFEDTSGAVTVSCFCVSMWEPVRPPHLEQNVLHREQGWCNLSLVCAVPGANNVSYSWTCSGDPLGDPEPRSWVHLQVHDDDNLTVCSCHASNPVSWSVVSTDIVAACRAAASGLPLSCGTELLEGLQGQSLSFPALHPMAEDIVRVTWRFQGTHIAEAKPRQKLFTVDYLPRFRGRLFIHPASLSLEIRLLKPGDGGRYEVVMDTFSDPTNPKIFSYLLLVNGDSPATMAGPGDAGGHSGSTAGPRGVTEPPAADTVTWGAGGSQRGSPHPTSAPHNTPDASSNPAAAPGSLPVLYGLQTTAHGAGHMFYCHY